MGISDLYYPWGFVLQILALIHFFRRRPEGYWFFIIMFLGALGALYLAATARYLSSVKVIRYCDDTAT